jgi:hypothetical protein
LSRLIAGLPPSLLAQNEHKENAEPSSIDKDRANQASKPVNQDEHKDKCDGPSDKGCKCLCNHAHNASIHNIARYGEKSREIFFP